VVFEELGGIFCKLDLVVLFLLWGESFGFFFQENIRIVRVLFGDVCFIVVYLRFVRFDCPFQCQRGLIDLGNFRCCTSGNFSLQEFLLPVDPRFEFFEPWDPEDDSIFSEVCDKEWECSHSILVGNGKVRIL
jgi:hypothetical protein